MNASSCGAPNLGGVLGLPDGALLTRRPANWAVTSAAELLACGAAPPSVAHPVRGTSAPWLPDGGPLDAWLRSEERPWSLPRRADPGELVEPNLKSALKKVALGWV